jgi:hypothetical protein
VGGALGVTVLGDWQSEAGRWCVSTTTAYDEDAEQGVSGCRVCMSGSFAVYSLCACSFLSVIAAAPATQSLLMLPHPMSP